MGGVGGRSTKYNIIDCGVHFGQIEIEIKGQGWGVSNLKLNWGISILKLNWEGVK